jgi:hypothetical protein
MGEWLYRSMSTCPLLLLVMSSQLHAPASFSPEEVDPSNHWTRGWVVVRARSGRYADVNVKSYCLFKINT